MTTLTTMLEANMPTTADDRLGDCVMLAHGGGGELTSQLVREHLLPQLRSTLLAPLTDGAIVPWQSEQVVFTTDSYVVTPLEFPGGDIGRLAVAGTVNDLAVMGAHPVALSLGLIIEEGLPLRVLDRVMATIRRTCDEACAEMVTGDTKVIERRTGEGMFINTAGIGRVMLGARLDLARVEPDDVVICNGPIAEHGLTIMSLRQGLEFDTDLQSDAAPLNGLIADMMSLGADIKFMRDATRGGLAGVLADISERRNLSIVIDEANVPMTATARRAAEMLGLDPMGIANEGKFLTVVAPSDVNRVIDSMRRHLLGRHAAVIGRVTSARPALVELNTVSGGRRIVQRPYGEDLPRIC